MTHKKISAQKMIEVETLFEKKPFCMTKKPPMRKPSNVSSQVKR